MYLESFGDLRVKEPYIYIVMSKRAAYQNILAGMWGSFTATHRAPLEKQRGFCGKQGGFTERKGFLQKCRGYLVINASECPVVVPYCRHLLHI